MGVLTKTSLPVGGALIGYNSVLSNPETPFFAGLNSTVGFISTYNTAEKYVEPNTKIITGYPRPRGSTIDYIAITSHNLRDSTSFSTDVITVEFINPSGTIKTIGLKLPQESTSGTDFFSIDPVENVDFIEFTFGFSGTDPLKIGNLMTGKTLEMPNPIMGGHSPAQLSVRTEYQGSGSKSGQFLGRRTTMQKEVTAFTFNNLDAQWVRDNIQDFILAAKAHPFYIKWRPDKYTEEASYGYVDSDIKIKNQTHNLMSMSFNFVGYVAP